MLNRMYTIRNDAIWAPVTKAFAELPDSYDRNDAYDRYMHARKATIDLLIQLAPSVKGLLTAEQRRKIPPFIARHLEPRYLASIRSGTAGFTGGSMFGMAPVMSSDVMIQGGAGARQIIITR
jgi:hypothetical protein